MLKTCSKCQQILPVSSFTISRERLDGYYPQCRECRKAFREANKEKILLSKRRHREVNKEQINEQQRRNYHNNREARLARNADWRSKNKERLKKYFAAYAETRREHYAAKSRRYYASHREEIRIKNQRRYYANKGTFLIYSRNRKARIKSAPGAFSFSQWSQKLQYWGYRCYLCKTSLKDQKIHIEHRIPISRGGSNWVANVAPACQTCNCKKHDKTEKEYRSLMLLEYIA